jgi:hypothetical protein
MHRLSDFSLPRGIALRWMKVLNSTATLGCASMISAAKPAQARVPVLLQSLNVQAIG